MRGWVVCKLIYSELAIVRLSGSGVGMLTLLGVLFDAADLSSDAGLGPSPSARQLPTHPALLTPAFFRQTSTPAAVPSQKVSNGACGARFAMVSLRFGKVATSSYARCNALTEDDLHSALFRQLSP